MYRTLLATTLVLCASRPVGVVQSWTTLNPVYAGAGDLPALELVYDRLFFRSPSDGTWTSRVVADVTVARAPDAAGPTLQVALVPGVRWHDGAPLRAEDVCFTVSALLHPDNPLNRWRQHLVGCAVVGGRAHVRLSHPAPDARALAGFHLLPAHPFPSPVIPADHPIRERPIGTGPMNAEVHGDEIRLVAFSNPHHDPSVQRLTLRRSDGFSALAPFETLGISDGPLAPADPALLGEATPVPARRWTWIAVAPDRAPWSDPRAREALDLLLDRPALFAALGVPAATPPLAGPFLAGSDFVDPAVAPTRRDAVRAEDLLRQVGVVRGQEGWIYQGKPLHVTVGVDPALLRRFRDPPGSLAAAVQKAGFAVTPYLHRGGAPAHYDLYLGATVVGDDETLDPLLHTPTATRGYNNPLRWSNPTTDTLLEAAWNAADADAAREAGRALHRNVAETRPLIPLFEDPMPSGYSWPVRPLAPVYGFTSFEDWRAP